MPGDARVVFDTFLDESGLKRGFDRLKSSVGSLSSGLGVAVGMGAAALAAGVVSSIGAVVDNAIQTASRLEEVQNVVNVTFGESTDAINEFAVAAKDAYGLSELAAKRYTSTIGAMVDSIDGIDSNKMLEMSKGLTGRTSDWASFYNFSYDEAFVMAQSVISGESESLKKIGVNMSVANLEAFALAQGITKTYQKMSQAEQVTLRYNYVMQATSKSQGDFARTSDGYANQQRILATTQEELAATMGEILLPVAIDVTKAFNGLAVMAKDTVKGISAVLNPPKSELEQIMADADEAVTKLNASVADAGKTLDTSLNTAKAAQSSATALLSNYDKIISKNVLTSQDTEQLKSIARQIVAIYPDMGASIDLTTGLFNKNTTAIKDNITSLSNQQLAMAYYSATEALQSALMQATIAEGKARDAHEATYDSYIEKNNMLLAAKGLSESIASNNNDYAMFADQLINLDAGFADFFVTLSSGQKVVKTFSNGMSANDAIAAKLKDTTWGLSYATDASKSKSEEYDRTLQAATQTVADLGVELETEQGYLKGFGDAFTPPTIAAEKATDTMNVFAKATKEAAVGAKYETSEMHKLRTEYAAFSEETLDQIDAQIKGFERVKKARPKAAKQTTADINSQTKSLDDYAANLKKAKEKGIDPAALLELSDYTTENAAILAGLATAKAKEVTSFNEAYAARETERAEFVAAMATETASLTDANTSFTTLSDTAATAVQSASKATTTTIVDESAKGVAAADNIKQAASDVVSSITTIADDSATELTEAGNGVVESVSDGIKSNDKIKTTLGKKTAEAIASARNFGTTQGYSIGTNTVAGIVQGINAHGYKINVALAAALGSALLAVMKLLGIRSPSTVMRDLVGKNMALGVGVGFQDTMSGMSATMGKALTESAQAGLKTLNSTMLGQALAMTGISAGMPSMSSVSASTLKGSTLSGLYGTGSTSGNVSTIDARQYITFQSTMQAPDEIARSIRKQNTYGLAGART